MDDTPHFHGWIKKRIDGNWLIACSTKTREDAERLVKKMLKGTRKWSEFLVLPYPETPLCDIMFRKRS